MSTISLQTPSQLMESQFEEKRWDACGQEEEQQLLSALREAARNRDSDWLQSLCPRKLDELSFHDQWRDESSEENHDKSWQTNSKFYATTGASTKYLHDWIRENAPGKILLDYACGNGTTSIFAAKAGAKLAVGIDISDVSVKNAENAALHAGVSDKTYFLQSDCENTDLPDNSVDIVICNGMLHHLDLSYALPELRRILKPGGVCFCYESLADNPLFKLYRRLTPRLRTEWETEHILSHRDLKFASRFFDVENVRHWHLAAIMATPLRSTTLFEPAVRAADAVDSVLLRVPGISSLAWIFTFELRKRAESNA